MTRLTPLGGPGRAPDGTRSTIRPDRRGFALIAVLWVLVGLAALSLASTLVAREALASARNRVALTRAAWLAEGCTEAARAAIADALGSGRVVGADAGAAWRQLERAASASALWPEAAECDVALVPAGDKVDLNAADGEQLRALFGALGIAAERADSLADALVDWRDADDLPRPRGAERTWYERAGRRVPRGRPLAAPGEVARVRGFDSATVALVSAAAWVEPGRLSLSHAPRAALASLPGFGDEAVARLAELREGGGAVEVPALAGRLSRPAAAALAARFTDLVALETPEPDAWILTARARTGAPGVTAAVELRLVRAGARAAVVRRRTGP